MSCEPDDEIDDVEDDDEDEEFELAPNDEHPEYEDSEDDDTEYLPSTSANVKKVASMAAVWTVQEKHIWEKRFLHREDSVTTEDVRILGSLFPEMYRELNIKYAKYESEKKRYD